MNYHIKTLVIAGLGLLSCTAHSSLIDLGNGANDNNNQAIALTQQASGSIKQSVLSSTDQAGLNEIKQNPVAKLSDWGQAQLGSGSNCEGANCRGGLTTSVISWHYGELSIGHNDKEMHTEEIHFHHLGQPAASYVPLPATIWLFVTGLLGLGGRKFWFGNCANKFAPTRNN